MNFIPFHNQCENLMEVNVLEKKTTKEKKQKNITEEYFEIATNLAFMNEGKVEMEGCPKEIFSKKELLEKMHLDVPFALKFSEKLQTLGINIRTSKNTGTNPNICK